ncbi:molting protein mlt-4 [Anaeramoeba flamelloides]|uniref:Molting protein mlt-4 n=1 Tax=Anaeramoeba flamelloides TaxID=1746091 RepID=A0ABQ8XCC7_9EUKA|nr:molting protein mlt-4 [Anaeramoeba flamelloides]
MEKKNLSRKDIEILVSGDSEAISQLLKTIPHNTQESDTGCTVLHYLCLSKCVYGLIKKGIELGHLVTKRNYQNETALHYLMRTNCVSINFLNLFINSTSKEFFFSLDNDHLTPFLVYCSNENIEVPIVEWFLELGCELNQMDRRNKTALNYLCSNLGCNLELLKLFLEHGADPNILTVNGKNSLYNYCQRSEVSLPCIQLLVEGGSDLNHEDWRGETSLHLICKNSVDFSDTSKVLKILEYCFQKNANPNKCDKLGRTAFHYLFFSRLIQNSKVLEERPAGRKIVELFFQNGAKANLIEQSHKNSVTHLLCKKRSYYRSNPETWFQLLKCFEENNADFSLLDDEKKSFLHLSFEGNLPITIEQLNYIISLAQDIANVQDKNGLSSIHYIIQLPHIGLQILKKLKQQSLINFLETTLANENALFYYFKRKNLEVEVIKYLVQCGIDIYQINTAQNNIFHNYLKNEKIDLDILYFLIESYPDLLKRKDARNRTPLHYICSHSVMNLEILTFLTKHTKMGVFQENKYPESPLQFLFSNPSITLQMVRFLAEEMQFDILKNTNISNQPLVCLCKNKIHKFEIIKYLVEHLKSPIKENHLETKNIYPETTPLMIVSQRSNFDPKLITYFIEKGADLNRCNKSYSTAFHFICKNSQSTFQLFQLCLQNGADPNLPNSSYDSPFYYLVCEFPDPRIVQLFLNFGADPIFSSKARNAITNLTDILSSLLDITKIQNILKNLALLIPYIPKSKLTKDPKKNPYTGKLLHQLFRTQYSLKQDFLRFLVNQELTDNVWKGIKIHKLLVELRTNKKIEEVTKSISNFNQKDILEFVKWIYGIKFNKLFSIKNIFNKLDIKNPESKLFTNDLKKMYYMDETKDFSIICENKEIKVHKLILQSRSEFFRGMFLSVEEKTSQINDYSNRSFKAMNLFIKFLYFNEIDLKEMDGIDENELLDIGDFFLINKNSSLSYYINLNNFIKVFTIKWKKH